MAHIDFKVTMWQRVEVPEDADMNYIQDLVKRNDPNEINSYLEEISGGDFPEVEDLLDTASYIDPKDNDGESTIELIDDDAKTIATNTK